MTLFDTNSIFKRLFIMTSSTLLAHLLSILTCSIVAYYLDSSTLDFIEILKTVSKTTLLFVLVATMATYGLILLFGELQGFLYVFFGKKWMYISSLLLIISRYIILYVPMFLGAFNHI